MCGSRLEMIAETMEGVICISINRESVLSGKLGRNTSDESRLELEENLWAKHSSLSAEDDDTSNRLKSGGEE